MPATSPETPLAYSPPRTAEAANRSKIAHYRVKSVHGTVKDDTGADRAVTIDFQVMDVKRTMISTTELSNKGIGTMFGPQGDRLVIGARGVPLERHGDRSFLRFVPDQDWNAPAHVLDMDEDVLDEEQEFRSNKVYHVWIPHVQHVWIPHVRATGNGLKQQ